MKNKWWGYIHENGSLHIRRFFDEESINDAYFSPFVKQVFKPFEADSRVHAENILIDLIRQNKCI